MGILTAICDNCGKFIEIEIEKAIFQEPDDRVICYEC